MIELIPPAISTFDRKYVIWATRHIFTLVFQAEDLSSTYLLSCCYGAAVTKNCFIRDFSYLKIALFANLFFTFGRRFYAFFLQCLIPQEMILYEQRFNLLKIRFHDCITYTLTFALMNSFRVFLFYRLFSCDKWSICQTFLVIERYCNRLWRIFDLRYVIEATYPSLSFLPVNPQRCF